VIGFLGGTGPQGRGLGLRLALAGHAVMLGSRSAEKAESLAVGLKVLARGADVRGGTNQQVAGECDVCFVALPYEGQRSTLEGLARDLEGKLVVNCVNALRFDGGPRVLDVEAGSSAEECRQLLPGARVTAAFHTVSAPKLLDPERTLEGDVPVCGDDPSDRETVVRLANAIGGLRGIHAGPLYHSRTLEALTALIISVNKLYKTSAGVQFTGVKAGHTGFD
jgi:8-hydroxy-5-deazaflavin:NADPH oxidoreductase